MRIQIIACVLLPINFVRLDGKSHVEMELNKTFNVMSLIRIMSSNKMYTWFWCFVLMLAWQNLSSPRKREEFTIYTCLASIPETPSSASQDLRSMMCTTLPGLYSLEIRFSNIYITNMHFFTFVFQIYLV